jgi:hypothetical protein
MRHNGIKQSTLVGYKKTRTWDGLVFLENGGATPK